MHKAVFLDRDGTINEEVGIITKKEQIFILPGVVDGIKQLKKLGFLVIVVTNQSVIARGLIKEEDLDLIHSHLLEKLSKRGALIDGLYYCPYHPEANLKKYRRNSVCRKPNTGMIKRAQKDFNLDIKNSFIIGDSTSDILCGKRSKMKTILIKTGLMGSDKKFNIVPDFEAKNFKDAVNYIKLVLKKYEK